MKLIKNTFFIVIVLSLFGIVIYLSFIDPPEAAEGTYTSEKDEGANAVIELKGDSIFIDDLASAVIEDSTITIIKPGNYEISGTLNDGQIIVDVTKEEKVTLAFNGVNITAKNTAPVYVKSADRVKIECYAGTENVLTDGEIYYFSSSTQSKPNACIYSKDDLTISGPGTLTVNANYNNGIGCKNDLLITNGTITVNAYKNALKGNGSVTVERGTINLTAQYGDGIKTDDNTANGKGYVLIEGGNINIKSGDDGIHADTLVVIRSATVIVDSLKHLINCDNKQIDENSLQSVSRA